ncbi:hypothetical protein OG21DRAFT_1491267 [Imleria badia]|nr:hypothetical protein OG21DRAFT_1491267 [Imleria badia]
MARKLCFSAAQSLNYAKCQGETGDPDGRYSLPAFSKEEFYKRLIAFITANDQSISVVEHRKFRDLLSILCKNLCKSDISYWSTICNKIMAMWTQYLVSVKKKFNNALS